MTKIVQVAKARKSPGVCGGCGKTIEAGEAYNHVSVGFRGRKQSRHATCPQWRPSELESNDSRAIALAAIEAATDALSALSGEPGDLADVQNILEECADGLREAGESWTEKADNIESGFGHETELSAELREKADEMEGAVDQLDQEKDSLEDFEADDEDDEPEIDPEDGCVNEKDPYAEDAEPSEAKQAWWDELLSAAESAVSDAEGAIP